MTAVIEIEVPSEVQTDGFAIEYDYINVEFTVETTVEENYHDEKFLVPDGELTWEKAKHTKWENEAIATHIAIHENWMAITD